LHATLAARAQAPKRAIGKPPGLARGGRTLARNAASSKGGTLPFARSAQTSARDTFPIARGAAG
jgi:hypothetical protein